LTGPSYSNGTDIARLLLKQGAALQVANAAELAAAVRSLLSDPAARQRMGASGRHIVEANRGSVRRLLALIEPLVPDPASPMPAAAAARPLAGC
jgi:3-deoxy-D-manno-octulosonic-acid transferase